MAIDKLPTNNMVVKPGEEKTISTGTIVLIIFLVALPIILLVTVAAVTILWAAMAPLIDVEDGSTTSCFEVQNSLMIDSDSAYTCFDDTEVKLRIRRGRLSDELVAMEIAVRSADKEVRKKVRELPGKNGAEVYSYSFEELGLSQTDEISVRLFPIVEVDNQETICQSTMAIDLVRCGS